MIRPFAGPAPPAAIFFYSPDRTGQHPKQHLAEYSGILQADAYTGFNELYISESKPGPISEAECWAHGRRKLFELAELGKAPIAVEAGAADRCHLRCRACHQWFACRRPSRRAMFDILPDLRVPPDVKLSEELQWEKTILARNL